MEAPRATADLEVQYTSDSVSESDAECMEYALRATVTAAEAKEHLAAFEAMEAIPNHNKSGRALRRLVETNLVTGYPQVALKYIGLLRQTMAYRAFALRLLPLARHPALIKEHPSDTSI